MTPAERKARPLYSGLLKYFPNALMEVAHCSYIGNAQHNGAGTPLRWDRTKSTDEHDALMRHLLQAGEMDSDGVLHSTKVAWRALSALEKELEALAGKSQAVAEIVAENEYAKDDEQYGHGV